MPGLADSRSYSELQQHVHDAETDVEKPRG